MAKKKEKQNIKPGPVVQKQPLSKKQKPDKNAPFIERFSHTTIIIALSVITWIIFKNALNNQLTDWDDKGYILTDALIKDLSWHGWKEIFSTPVMGHYHPITILTYALEYHIAQLNPWLYHFDSIFLHMLTVIVAYWFAYLLTKSKTAAVITALLFSIYPMHVESVAWVAGRKDILCTLFYLGSCIAYLFYVRTNDIKEKRKKYAWAFALFIGASLCKPVAVTVPLVLLLIDYYEKRSWKISILYEKVPFFVLALLFGLISIKINHEAGILGTTKVSYTFLERINLMSYAFFIYIGKAVLPIHLHNFYAYPAKVNGALPYYYFAYPFIMAALVAAGYFLRNKKEFVFGALFFVFNIILLVKFVPVGDAIVAERYSYTSYFGLFFIAGSIIALFIKRYGNRYPIYLALIIYFIGMGYVSAERCKAWYDTSTLWTDEMKKEPMAPVPYNNLGFYYFDKHAVDPTPAERKTDFDSAFYFLHKAVDLKPDYVNSVEGLGILYFLDHKLDSATYFFRTFIQLKPCSEAYYDYGLTLDNTNKRDSALIEYSQSILLDSMNWKPRLNRGIIYEQLGRWDEALNDINGAIKIDSGLASAYYQRSFYYNQKRDNRLALQDVNKAISLGFNEVNGRYYQGLKNQ